MAGYRLREGLSFCRLGERCLFLDLEEDRYFCLSPDLESVFAKLIEGMGPNPDEAAALRRAGLLVAFPTEHRPQPCSFPAPTAISPLPDRVSTSRILVLAVLARRAIWTYRLRKFPLAANFEAVSRRKRALASKAVRPRTVARLVQAYRCASLLVSSHDQCLATSMALMSDLLALGARADLALGVKLNPFQAHCWVQLDGAVIGDEPDAVRPFTPIHVI